MIENIRKEFKIIVNKNEWMDEKSKKNALDKADYIDVKVGFPDYTYNNTHLDSLYENVTMKLVGSYVSTNVFFCIVHIRCQDLFEELDAYYASVYRRGFSRAQRATRSQRVTQTINSNSTLI